MKIKSTILALALAAFAFSVNAQSTNRIEQPTNINQAVVSILMGAKDVGGQIFDASKSAIAQSVTFIQAQAPDVIKEFLRWHLFEDFAYILFGVILGIIGLLVGSRLIKYASKQSKENGYCDDAEFYAMLFGWIFRVTGTCAIIIPIIKNGLDALEILVAPKIYLIDYITTLIQNH